MARAAKMEGEPTDDGDIIRATAEAYLGLAVELDQRRASTKATTSGKTEWRRVCVQKRVDPVILADAAELVRKVKDDPDKITRNWRLFMGYLQVLGFFDHLVPGLFDEFEVKTADNSAKAVA